MQDNYKLKRTRNSQFTQRLNEKLLKEFTRTKNKNKRDVKILKQQSLTKFFKD